MDNHEYATNWSGDDDVLAAALYPYVKFDEYTDNYSGRLVIQARLDVIVPDEREV